VRTPIILFFRILFIGAFLGVTVLSVVPAPQMSGLESDKLSHFIAYSVLTLLLVLSLSGSRGLPRGFWVALVLVLLYGVLIEVLQHYIGRQFDLNDMVANAVGVALGAGTGLLARRLLRSPE
jgi:VanZ family protein